MEKNDFNTNAAAVANGNYFGMPYTVDEASVVLISVPWDVTTSYRPGTSKGPEAIIAASPQLDFFDLDVEDAWKIGIGTVPIDPEVKFLNEAMRPLAEKVISHLENGGDPAAVSGDLATVNAASILLNQKIFQTTKQLLQRGKLVGLIGGEHSVPFGFLSALAESNPGFGILHIDAHADLRQAYEGFTYSHASIMYNALKLEGISKLVQVAVRDECEDEVKLVNSDDRIIQFDDYLLAAASFEGKMWGELCSEIVS